MYIFNFQILLFVADILYSVVPVIFCYMLVEEPIKRLGEALFK